MLIYLICLLILGLPVMTMEFSVGRAARTSPIYMYQKLEKPGHKWGIFGIVSLIGNITLMAFYTVVCGWLIYYFVKFLTGQNQSFGFTQMIQNPSVNVSYLLVTVIVAFLILSFDLQGGLERITKYMMTSLLVLMLVLAVHSLTLSGAANGLKFYLVPDFSKINGSVIVGAMNQAFLGAKAFGDATTRLYQNGGSISIWLDDENVSTASVNAAITDGSAIITSSASSPFTQEDVVKMARQINSGSLPFALTVDSYSTISPSLGENSLSAMVLAGVIAFALIVVLMTALYRLPGFLACIALAGQVAATLAFVSGYFPVFESFTLTLPGIAGIILAIGMGVDANVITAERIKEELRSGKSLDGALKSGFARGLTPIIDGNVTIVIVAIVLMGAFGPSDGFFAKALHFVFFAFGPSTAGTIYAFGYTLLTGVLLNFVFGIFATRTMIRGAASIKALRDPRLYGADAPGKTPAEKKQVNFVGLRKRFLTFSACLMAAIVLCAVVLGVHLDTEFTGGAMITLSYENSFEMSAVQKTASEALSSNGLTLQTGENVATGEQTLKISMPGTETVTTDEVQTLLDSLNESCPDNSFAQLSLSNVSAAMGTKFLQKSLVAVVFALVLILAYIAYRFKKIGGLTGGMMAVLALLNDLMVVFGTFVLLRAPLDGNFIAAMLTILGYSINDTVVVYDRIRENRSLLGKKASFEELVNHSVNQSARRTIITTVTTVMALGVMCVVSKLYGLDSIFTFAFPLMMGMLSGVYTSLCVSTSAWVAWSERKGVKKN